MASVISPSISLAERLAADEPVRFALVNANPKGADRFAHKLTAKPRVYQDGGDAAALPKPDGPILAH
jgi:hypothetical protein